MSPTLTVRPASLPLLMAVCAWFFLNPECLPADGLYISGVSPTSGSTTGGTLVTISGREFTGATAVVFGATSATSFTVVDNNTITAASPAEPAGTVDIRVTVADPTTPISVADEFTYIATTVPTPTLGQWSTIALAFLLAGTGCLRLKKAAAA